MELFAAEKSSVAVMASPACANWIVPLLQGEYQVGVARETHGLLTMAQEAKSPALILIEHTRDHRPSLQLCLDLKNDPRTWDIPIVVCSSMPSAQDEVMAFESGAADYLNLPLAPEIFMVRVKSQLAIQSKIGLIRQLNQRLEDVVSRGVNELTKGVPDHGHPSYGFR